MTDNSKMVDAVKYAIDTFNIVNEKEIDIDFIISNHYNIHLIVNSGDVQDIYFQNLILHLKKLYPHDMGIDVEYYDTRPNTQVKLSMSNYIYIPNKYKGNLYIRS